jgi:hypothetical protein
MTREKARTTAVNSLLSGSIVSTPEMSETEPQYPE